MERSKSLGPSPNSLRFSNYEGNRPFKPFS